VRQVKSRKIEVGGADVDDLEGFRKYLLERGYSEGNVNRLIPLVKRILEAGGPDSIEPELPSPWMRRKVRYAWRKYQEFLRVRTGGAV